MQNVGKFFHPIDPEKLTGNFFKLLDKVYLNDKSFLIKKAGIPVAEIRKNSGKIVGSCFDPKANLFSGFKPFDKERDFTSVQRFCNATKQYPGRGKITPSFAGSAESAFRISNLSPKLPGRGYHQADNHRDQEKHRTFPLKGERSCEEI